jgi:lysophospholipase L1-like esterase
MKTRMMISACLWIGIQGAFGQATEPTTTPVANVNAREVAGMRAKLADWAQLGRYGAEDTTLGANAKGRVVFYGDSITDMWGREVGTFFPGKPYVNRGISGQTTPQMLVRFRQDVIDLHPAAVLILAGTNDIAGNTGPETQEMIENNFKSMAELARGNDIRFIIASILPAADYPWKPGLNPAPKIQALNRWLAGYCAAHSMTYLDYYSAMATKDGGMKPGLSLDGVHPTAAGFAIMGPLAQAAVDKALSGDEESH